MPASKSPKKKSPTKNAYTATSQRVVLPGKKRASIVYLKGKVKYVRAQGKYVRLDNTQRGGWMEPWQNISFQKERSFYVLNKNQNKLQIDVIPVKQVTSQGSILDTYNNDLVVFSHTTGEKTTRWSIYRNQISAQFSCTIHDSTNNLSITKSDKTTTRLKPCEILTEIEKLPPVLLSNGLQAIESIPIDETCGSFEFPTLTTTLTTATA